MSKSLVLGLRARQRPDLSLIQANLEPLNPGLTCQWLRVSPLDIDSVGESIFALDIQNLSCPVSALMGHLQSMGYSVSLLKNEASQIPCIFS
ncbi:hypothetical protein [Polynucleobacter sp. MWH-Loch1C5]|uniref:hypothetical protein n=1 Tax=Polynucleobacter sp. MWH-Loch1C5 TaxID=2689108 RepID=UPI001C0C72F0|nr:hypothetical protein [Polynucleobacter sp. MWH-Loch1C5]